MFRPPYRWTCWYGFRRNIVSCYYDIINGVKNLYRWIPIIWFDMDFDWVFLAALMEVKLRFMVKNTDYWMVADKKKAKRNMLVCAELLKRLKNDNYYEDACKVFKGKNAALHSIVCMNNDQKYLGKILGKYLNHWWD